MTRYRIEWRIDGKDYSRSQWRTSRSTTYTTNDQANLANGVRYFFRVRAGNGSGNSYGPYGPASGEVSATPTSGSAVDLGTPVLSNTENLHHGMVRLDWEDIEDAGWYVVQYYHIDGGSREWVDLPAEGVDIAFHGSSAVVSNLHGLSWLRVGAMSCAGESEWSQIEQLFGTNASDWEGVPVPELAEGDEIEPCPVVLGTPVLSDTETLHHGMVQLDWQDVEDAGWYVVQYYHVKGGEWLDLPAAGVDIALHGSSAVLSNLHGLSWLRVRAMSCAGESEWSQIEQLFGTNASDWEGVPVPEVAEGDEIEPCSEDAATPDNSPATGAPTISGTAQVGETLTADTSGIADADGRTNATFSYQWLVDDSDISGAANATYTLVDADEGKVIKVEVSFTDDAGNGETLTSGATDAVAAAPTPNSPATGAPAISGTAQVGETLTADTSGIADANGLSNVQYEYQWLADDAEIAGATGSTYLLVAEDEGKAITVRVSFTDDADNLETLTSGATDAVAAAEPSEPPAKPTGLSGTATHDSVALTWDDPQDDSITGYVILRRVRENDQGGEFSELAADTGSAATGYTDDTVAAGITYTYRIKAINGAGTSERSRWLHVDTPEAPAPDTPSERDNSPATGAPTISGTAQVGETLSALTSGIADEDGLEDATFTYQWLADDSEIAGAAGSTHTLADSDEGKAVRVRVSFTDDAGNEEILTSAATDAVAAAPTPNIPATGAPTISGTAQVGETLTADTSGIADADGLGNVQYEYQWLADDTDIAGAAGSTYTVAAADEGKAIKVEVSFTDDVGNDESLTSAATDAVAARPNSLATGAPTISGTAQVGETLTADTSGIADADGLGNVQYEYQWLADDAEIAGAAGSTHTLAAADEGKAIKVEVSFADDAGNDETLTSPATDAVVAEPLEPPAKPTGLTGTASHDSVTLTWDDPQDESITGYAVLRRIPGVDPDGRFRELVADTGTTATTHTDDTVKSETRYTYRIKAINGAGTSERSRWFHIDTPASPAPEPANSPATGAPTISGTAQVGETLTANTSGIADADGLGSVQYEHQWLADDAEIAGAASSTYTLVAADEGRAIKVEVSFTDDAGNDEALTSAATDAVAARPNSFATGAPTISGTTQVGETLTADTSGISDADGLSNVQYQYRWLADAADISGATNATYTLVAADEGKAIRVRVSFTDDEGNDESLTSAATDAVAAEPTPNSPSTGAPTISGTVQVGETLTANTSGISDADGLSNVQHEYQWLADDADIPGATASTYTLSNSDEAKAIKVEVTFSDDAGNGETLTSAATDAVAAEPAANNPATGAPTISGTAQVGETLAADTSGMSDADGLSNVSFSYQWLADDAEIAGATGSTYTLADSDEGKKIKVQVSFTDDAGNGETLTSAATDAVAAAEPAEPPAKPRGLSATATHDSVTLTWDDPGDDSITGYVILRRNRDTDAEGHFNELVADTGRAAATYTDATVAAENRYTYRIKAINEHGTSERSRWYHVDTPAAP